MKISFHKRVRNLKISLSTFLLLFLSLFINVYAKIFQAMKHSNFSFLFILIFFVFIGNTFSQNTFNSKFDKIVFGCYAKDIADFEAFVQRAKQSGATHINLSNEDLPFAKWEYDTPGDPYPSWVFTNMGLLKIATPAALKPYLPQDYAEKVISILEERCKVLRKYGLKAAFKTFEPQMLPEKVYEDHPLWRGPRVDHPSRSRVARWAPDVDNPEVLELYREAFGILLKRCPEIEIMSLTTNDSGTGLSWSGGLYSGATGNTFTKYRRTEERIASFFAVFKDVAKAKGATLDVDFFGTREDFPEKIAENLTEGMAIENLEGPDGRPFKSEVGFVMDYYQVFYPVIGVPDPVQFLEELENANNSKAKRLFVLFGDRYNKDLYFNIYDQFNARPSGGDLISRLMFLKKMAAAQVGEQAADHLFNIWLSLQDARKAAILTDNGGYIFYLGAVQQRWLTRPFVPFPEELGAKDRDYFRKYQFQARTEENANDMADLQASRIFSGWSGRFFVSKSMNITKGAVSRARRELAILLKSELSAAQKKEFEVLALRLKALDLLADNSKNAISYQAQLDRTKANICGPDKNPAIGTSSSGERTLMLETARQEIDNTALLLKLLESTNEEILDIAPTKDLEDIRRLGPDFTYQLKLKLRIMNEHWQDYNRLFTIPNK